MKPLVTTLWRVAAIAALSWVQSSHAELIHRYSFTSNANDSVGTANGVARQTSTGGVPNGAPVDFTTEPGKAILDGVASYIDLPNNIISTQTNLTVEVWFDWRSDGGNWQRVFDFGVGSGGEDPDGSVAVGNGLDYIFFAPASGGFGQLPRFAAKDNDSSGAERPVILSPNTLGDGSFHVTVVYTTNYIRLFQDGVQVGIAETAIPLSAINDVNNFLGRSQYGGDALFAGSFNEVRIFNHALTAQEIAASYASGNPDALTYDPGAVTSLTLSANTSMLVGEAQTPTIAGEFATAGSVALYPADVTFTSSNPAAVSITKTGALKAEGAGSSTITASLGGKTSSVTVSVAANPPMLINRYSFSEAQGSTEIIDSVGNMNGTLVLGTNAPVQNGSSLKLTPVNSYANASYVDLPDGVISSRGNASLEMWVTWDGPTSDTWARVFDIGASGKGDDAHNSGGGQASWWFSPTRGGGIYGMDVWNGSTTVSINGPVQLPTARQVHLVCIYAPNNQTAKLYLDGRLIATGAAPFALSTLNDANVWLGVSNWDDPPFKGSFNEFRIWEGEMSDLDIALSAKAGPDALPVAPGNLVSVALDPIAATFIGNLGGAQAKFTGNFQNVSGVDISGLSGVTYSSSDTNVFAVTAAGAVTPRNLGTADLIAAYKGLSATTSVSILAPIAIRQSGLATNLQSSGLSFVSDLKADYTGVTDVTATTFAGVTRTSSDTNVLTISNAGLLTPRKTGTATVTATYKWVVNGVTNSLTDSVTATVAVPPGFIKGTLIHRYSFSEAADSAVVTDSVGGANGEVVNTTGADFTGTGSLNLIGGAATDPNPYVNLPNHLISPLTSFTIETWVTWNGVAGSQWQRIFDIGRNSAVDENNVPVEDQYLNPGVGYMFLTPLSGDNGTRFAIKEGTGAETPQLNTAALVIGAKTHVAVVYDTVLKVARLYINGNRVADGTVTLPLSVLEDINVYLGRSQWTDSLFNGTFDEFRIYDGPLLDADIAATYAAGPDSLPAAAGPTLTIGKAGSNIEITWPETAGFNLEAAGQLGGSFAPAGVTPTTNAGVVKATIPVPTGATNAFFQLKK